VAPTLADKDPLQRHPADGGPVDITGAGKLFARLVPATPLLRPPPAKPDILARLKSTWGDRVVSARQAAALRVAGLDGEDG
jgi:antitoxin (DNA-binding transcriptional repressor) of toxin-antitoxin stability system